MPPPHRPSRVPQLPPATAAALQGLRGTPGMHGPLLSLHEAGWSLAALAGPMGVTREGMRTWLRAAAALDPPRDPAPPPPPSAAARAAAAQEAATRARRAQRSETTAVALGRHLPLLLALQGDARALRGPSSSSPELAEASAAYTAALDAAINDGAPVAVLAEALGIKQATVYARLRRGGYRKRAPSEHVPQWAGHRSEERT